MEFCLIEMEENCLLYILLVSNIFNVSDFNYILVVFEIVLDIDSVYLYRNKLTIKMRYAFNDRHFRH